MVIPLSKPAFYFIFPSTTKLSIHTTNSTFLYVFTFSFTHFNSSVQTCNLFFIVSFSLNQHVSISQVVLLALSHICSPSIVTKNTCKEIGNTQTYKL